MTSPFEQGDLMTSADSSPEELGRWLTERVAYYTQRSETEIDPATPLTDYGLDSVYALTLSGEMEDRLSVRLDPTVMWDHQTINELVSHLLGLVADAEPAG
jgi:acyl carrier protein